MGRLEPGLSQRPEHRRFGKEYRAPKHPLFIPQPGLHKRRELRFHATPPDQIERARALLQDWNKLSVYDSERRHTLVVEYELGEHAFFRIESLLLENGFHLDGSLLFKLQRALILFCEETQLRNLQQPERLIKKSNDLYGKAWEHHPHGDHDDTPVELREYK